MQVHTVLQMKSELLEMSLSATKYITNHGAVSEQEAIESVRVYLRNEIAEKHYRLSEEEMQISIVRTKAADELKWSHADEFSLRMSVPYPQFTSLFAAWATPLVVERSGTINVMDYDL